MDDKTLAASAAGGDQESFTILVTRYRAFVYTIAYRILLDEDDALDVTQNVLMRLVEKIGDFKGRGSFRGWLATIAVREAYNHLRRLKKHETAVEPEELEYLAHVNSRANPAHPGDALDAAYRKKLIEATMKSLPGQQRAILALRLKEDMGPKDIATVLDIPAQQVRSQLHRAIARIRGIINKDRL